MALKREKQKKVEEGAPLWMTTFSDMMTLLLTFFVLIVSFSSISVAKFKSAMGSLQGAMGISKPEESIPSYLPQPLEALREREKLLKTIRDIEEYLKKGHVPIEYIQMHYDLNGIYLDVNNHLLFEHGDATLKNEALPFIDALSQMLKNEYNVNIEVNGHTDDSASISPQFSSNWELSTARALAVVKYFQEVGKIDGHRLSARGYAQYHPKFPNDTEAHRRANRRVEIFLKVAK